VAIERRDGADRWRAAALAGATLGALVAGGCGHGAPAGPGTPAGALVRVISTDAYQVYGFSGPRAMAVAGGHLFVANQTGTVTEVDASTGALVRPPVRGELRRREGGPRVGHGDLRVGTCCNHGVAPMADAPG
jgi:hypothetical protein